ncbi:MAG: alpha/beta hydrolase [Gammaproteobacteria bacterium]|nr:alpha/beta hydrolase [Gammaproteobacteria bacterium]
MSSESRPEWFQRAIDAGRNDAEVMVEGCKVHYATWGEVGKPGIILIHGSNAHLEWWRFVAPFLADQFRVASMDLSGNGDSGWREKYSGELYAKEVKAVCEEAQLGSKPFVVAHSFGGFVAQETGHNFGEELGGNVICDFTESPPENYTEWGRQIEENGGGTARPTRVYEDFNTALNRFRLVPEQPIPHPYVIEFIGRQSLRQVEGGWTWKFDPSMYDHLEMGREQKDKFLELKCLSALVLGEHSTDDGALSARYMAEITDSELPIITIPGTHHHFMFDEPMATVAAIKGILLAWIQAD